MRYPMKSAQKSLRPNRVKTILGTVGISNVFNPPDGTPDPPALVNARSGALLHIQGMDFEPRCLRLWLDDQSSWRFCQS